MKIYNLVSGMIPIQRYLKSKNIIRTGEFFFKFALNKEYYIGIDVYKFTSTQKTVLYIYLLDKKDRQLAHYTYVCRNKIYKIIDGDAHKLPEEFKGLFYDNSFKQLMYWMYCYMNTLGQKYGCPYVNVSFDHVKDKFVQEV